MHWLMNDRDQYKPHEIEHDASDTHWDDYIRAKFLLTGEEQIINR
jgi:hypothetical protein